MQTDCGINEQAWDLVVSKVLKETGTFIAHLYRNNPVKKLYHNDEKMNGIAETGLFQDRYRPWLYSYQCTD